MANASVIYENMAKVPALIHNTLGWLFHLMGGGDRGNELRELFSNPKNSIETPYPIDTLDLTVKHSYIDSNFVIKYSNNMAIDYLYAGDYISIDTTYRFW